MDDKPSRSAPNGSPDTKPGLGGDAAAWTVLAYLISGPLVYGGIGWLLDNWLDTGFLTPLGIVGGMALAIYVINIRYGLARRPSSAPPPTPKRPPESQ